MLLGLGQVIPQEQAWVRCRCVDLPHRPSPDDVAAVADELLDPDDELLVAWRGGRRHARIFEPFEPDDADSLARRLRDGGVYWILGGLGGVGLRLAEAVAGRVRARLVLTSRGAAAPGHPGIAALEALGAEVLDAPADAADPAALRAVLDRVTARFGRLDGVIHAAGVAGGGLVRLRTPASLREEARPKVDAARALAALLADRPLDFVVLCSSVNALAGGLGQAGYSAANAFLDAFAHAHAGKSPWPVVSIDWGRWRGIGLSVAGEAMHRSLAGEPLQGGMSPDEAIAAFLRVPVRADLAQIAVGPDDLPALLAFALHPAPESSATLLARRVSGGHRQQPRPALGVAYREPESPLERTVAALWSDLLGVQGIGVQDDFFELGGHSLLAIQLLGALRETYAVELSLRSLFEAPTVRGHAQLIESQLMDRIESMSDEEVARLL